MPDSRFQTGDSAESSPAAWMIDEVSYAGREHLDFEYAGRYDRKAQLDPGGDVELLVRRGLDANSTVIDLGAGTGTFALAVANHCARVIAVEPSPAMLDVLRRKTREAGSDNVDAVRAGFLSYAHRGPLADFAYSRNALHHLPDFWKALALQRIASAVKSGGSFLLRDIVYSFDLADASEAIEAWIRRGAATSEIGWTPDELAEHVREEHSTFSWLLEAMLERAGFDVAEASFTDSGIFAAFMCVRR